MTILEKYKAGELTVKEFLEAGYRFEVGDEVILSYGKLISIESPKFANLQRPGDDLRAVIKSKALGKELKAPESWHQKAINYLGDKDIRNESGINIYGISITEQEWKEVARLILWEKYDHL